MRLPLAFAVVAVLALAQPAIGVASSGRKVAAADGVACTVRSMHGDQSPGGIDKRLAFLQKQLSRPPFSAYKRIALVAAKALTISQGAKQKLRLPTGRDLVLMFKEKLLAKGKVRLRIHLSIQDPKTKRFSTRTLFTIADRGTLLVAGASYKKGTLIVGITCSAK